MWIGSGAIVSRLLSRVFFYSNLTLKSTNFFFLLFNIGRNRTCRKQVAWLIFSVDWSVHRNTVRGKQSTKWIKIKITLIILNDLIAFPIFPNKQRRFWQMSLLLSPNIKVLQKSKISPEVSPIKHLSTLLFFILCKREITNLGPWVVPLNFQVLKCEDKLKFGQGKYG